VEADDVAQVKVRESLVWLVAELVDLGQQLDSSSVVLDVRERGLPHHPDRDQATGQGDPISPGVGSA
jgi:hypothetical protein